MKVNILSKKNLFDGFFKIDEIHLQYQKFSGEMSDTVRRLNFERGDSVGVLLRLTDSGQFVFVNQFRYAVHERRENGWIDEIIAGTFTNESPQDCAYRETIEETGYKLTNLVPMGTFFVSPGGTTEKIYLYLGCSDSKHRISKGGGLTSENEDIEIKYYSGIELKEMLHNNSIRDAKTIIAVQHYLLNKDMFLPDEPDF